MNEERQRLQNLILEDIKSREAHFKAMMVDEVTYSSDSESEALSDQETLDPIKEGQEFTRDFTLCGALCKKLKITNLVQQGETSLYKGEIYLEHSKNSEIRPGTYPVMIRSVDITRLANPQKLYQESVSMIESFSDIVLCLDQEIFSDDTFMNYWSERKRTIILFIQILSKSSLLSLKTVLGISGLLSPEKLQGLLCQLFQRFEEISYSSFIDLDLSECFLDVEKGSFSLPGYLKA